LESIANPEVANLATRFASQVIALSATAAEQDPNDCVELFLRSIQDQRVIDGIRSGSISKGSRQLADLDFW